jgi:hypothetical protein
MGFTKITTVSKFWNPKDKGEGIPKPIICDSVFDPTKASATTNAELTIYLKDWFQDYKSAMGQIQDGKNVLWDVRDWGPGDNFGGWCQDVRTYANEAWNDRLTLIPPKRYDGIDVNIGGVTYRPNVRCRFELLIGDSSYCHAKVMVAIALPQPGKEFKTRSRVWNKDKSNILTPRQIHPPQMVFTAQRSSSHEIGHLMGLQHIGRVVEVAGCVCPDDRSSDKECIGQDSCEYGIYDPREEIWGNIMGAGMTVSEHNALPWQQEMCKHANRHETFGTLDPNEWTATKVDFVAPRKI